MTVEQYDPGAGITISTAGPHLIDWPYEAGAVTAQVRDGFSVIALAPDDFTVSPASSLERGALTLSPAAFAAHEGKLLLIRRETRAEQAWGAITEGRERSLERQLDRLTMRLQEIMARLGAVARWPVDIPELPLSPGRLIVTDAEGRPTIGPDADDVAEAAAVALAARDFIEQSLDGAISAVTIGPVVSDGVTRHFPAPFVQNAAQVDLYFDGIAQARDTYEVIGSEVILSEAPRPGVRVFGRALLTGSVTTTTADLVAVGGGGSVRDWITRSGGFPSRAAFLAALSWPWTVGAVVGDDRVTYRYTGTGTVIPDAPGWVPHGPPSPDHWTFNAVPGVTDMRPALAACAAYGDVHLQPGTYYVATTVSLSTRSVYFAAGAKLMAADGATITISGKINAADRQHIFEWAGAGAFTVTSQAYVSICWFGAQLNYANDASVACQKAVDSIPTGVVMVPSGAFRVDATVTISKSSVTVTGRGRGVSHIRKGSLTAHVFEVTPADPVTQTLFDIHFADLSFNTLLGDIHTGGACIKMTSVNRYSLARLAIASPYAGVVAAGCTNGSWNDVDIQHAGSAAGFNGAVGIEFQEITGRTGAGKQAANVFMDAVRVRSPEIQDGGGILYGLVVRASDGIWLSNCYFGSCVQADVLIHPQTTTSQVTGLKFDNCWFDPTLAFGVGNAVRIEGETSSPFGMLHFINCTFGGRNWSSRAVYVNISGAATALKQCSIVNCRISSYRNHGILVAPTSGAIVADLDISGNLMRACATTSIDNIPFIGLNGVSRYTIIGNKAGYADTFGTSEAVSPASYGLTISATCVAGVVTGNDFRGNTVGSILDASGANARTITGNLIDTSNVVASASTITIPAGITLVSVTGTTTINNVAISWPGRQIILAFSDACTVTAVGNIRPRTAFTSATGATLSLVFDGTNWRETARAA